MIKKGKDPDDIDSVDLMSSDEKKEYLQEQKEEVGSIILQFVKTFSEGSLNSNTRTCLEKIGKQVNSQKVSKSFGYCTIITPRKKKNARKERRKHNRCSRSNNSRMPSGRQISVGKVPGRNKLFRRKSRKKRERKFSSKKSRLSLGLKLYETRKFKKVCRKFDFLIENRTFYILSTTFYFGLFS